MSLSLTFTDENTDQSAMRSADEALGYCASLAMRYDNRLLPVIKEAQRRLRRRTNPEMFDDAGNYR